MQLIVAVNCTSKKTAKPSAGLSARDLGPGTVEQLVRAWNSRVRGASAHQIPARDLYSGRAFSLASNAAERADADLYVLSAGMGFVKHDALVPPYNLSVAPGTIDCILRRSNAEPFTASQWWAALHKAKGSRPLEKLLRRRPKAMLVVAATRPYIEMIEDELSSLAPSEVARLRIIGPTRPDSLPACLRPSMMPYDSRLNDADLGLQGTQFDFAARALAHFVGLVGRDAHIESPQDHAKRVRLSLAKRKAPVKPERERLDAAALERHMRALKKAGESKSSALRKLRRNLGCACEQQRFFGAWDAL